MALHGLSCSVRAADSSACQCGSPKARNMLLQRNCICSALSMPTIVVPECCPQCSVTSDNFNLRAGATNGVLPDTYVGLPINKLPRRNRMPTRYRIRSAYVYIHICVCTHTYKYIDMYLYASAHVYVHAYAHVHECVHV